MKKILIGTISAIVICFCLFLMEWMYTEISFQIWIRQDEQRIDFTIYDSEEQLRDSLLIRLPIGSSEEKTKSFHLANGDARSKWEPVEISDDRNGNVLRVVMVSTAKRSNIIIGTGDKWIILFLLDPMNRTLTDIRVSRFSGSQWP